MPDEIDASDSRPVFGGLYLHNYPEIFEACGFEPLLSLVVGNQNNSTFYTYYSVAVNREHTLPEKLKSQLQSWPKE